ncbi:MAG: methylase, partial [Gemmatimonadales bacterium]|nr:methylase [Gemmatimonadales bacterium]
GVAPPHHIGLHLWVLVRPDATTPQSVLFADATDPDSAALRDDIVDAWRVFATEPELRGPNARAVPIIDLLDDLVDVTPARHLATAHESPEEVAEALSGTSSRLRSLLAELPGLLPGDDWSPGKPEEGGWRTVTVADLSRSEGLQLHRAAASAPRPDETAADGVRVLTLSDVAGHGAPSGVVTERESGQTVVQVGDVVLPAVLTSRFIVRVASTQDEGALLGRHLHLLRPDPDRLDPWFLAGFLAAPANVRRAGYGSTLPRLDVRRLEVPLLPPDRQRGYAQAFRRLDAFEEMARTAVKLGTEVTGRLRDALTGGALHPPP